MKSRLAILAFILVGSWVAHSMRAPRNLYHVGGTQVNEEQYLKWNNKPFHQVANDPEFIELKQEEYQKCLSKNIDVVCEHLK